MSHSEDQIEVGPTTSYYHGVEVGIQQERERIIKVVEELMIINPDHKFFVIQAIKQEEK